MARKPLPDFTSLEQLFPPNDDYGFFEHAIAFDDSAPAQFSVARAWWLAEAALLAYSSKSVIEQAMPTTGWRCRVMAVSDSTQMFAMFSDRATIVSFRGTQLSPPTGFLADVLVNAQFPPLALGGGAWAHKGFYREAEAANAALGPLLAGMAPRSTWFTGHSLGGALAAICASLHGGAAGIYGFGMPRIGNRRFLDTSGIDARLWCVDHAEDVVPDVPPQFPFVYADPRNIVRINREGTLHGDQPASFNAARRLSDHAPIYYATHLYNLLA